MPNHCCNSLILNEDSLSVIVKNYIRKNERGEDIFDFERIEPVGDVPDLHEKRIEKWGTKWVGYDIYFEGYNIDFITAWSPPVSIIKKLAELHKDFVFRLEYYEPGCAFRGYASAKWKNGEALLKDKCWDMTDKDLKELGLTESDDDDAADVIRNGESFGNREDINYDNLFELWADFDDADAGSDIVRLINDHGLEGVHSVSFAAFCYGYEKAIKNRG